MRFGMMAAAAAALACATPASAYTIVQNFGTSFQDHGSIGPVTLNGLSLPPLAAITSITVNYTAGAGATYRYLAPGDATLDYTGYAGFQFYSLPIPAYVSSSTSGTTLCSQGVCTAGYSFSGTYQIPEQDFAAFLSPNSVTIAALGGISGTVFYNGQPQAATMTNYSTSARGSIIFDIAVPEPSSWLLMISGVGMIGAALRKRRKALPSNALVA